MGSLSKGYAYDAGKRDPKVPRTVYVKGERRSEKYPSGVIDRYVNLQGNVVQCQLLSPGLARSPDAIAKARGVLHRAKNSDGSVEGFIEHDRCPLRHAVNLRSPTLEAEFADMPMDMKRPCSEDPTVITRGKKGREYHDPCPHIQWVIDSRRAKEAERRSQRSGRTENVIEMERRKLAIAEQTLIEQRATNERMAQAVESAAATPRAPRKAPTE